MDEESCCPECGMPHPGFAHVEGVESRGFLTRVHDLQDTELLLFKAMREELGRGMANQTPHTMLRTVQLVNTLFEVAATVTAVLHPEASADDQAKLDLLHRVALDGLNLIGAKEEDADI